MQTLDPGGRELLHAPVGTASEHVLRRLLIIREQVDALYSGLLSGQGSPRRASPDELQTPPRPEQLHATFFGSFALYRDGERVQLGHNKTVLELCRFLIAHAGRAVPRDELLEMLWPEVDPTQALHRLHVTVSRLRHVVDAPGHAESQILLEDDNYSWSADSVTSDCAWFEDNYRRGKLLLAQRDEGGAAAAFAAAVDLYRGEYLAEHPFIEWTQPRRAHFAERQLNALTFLTEYAADKQNYIGVLEYAQAILEIDNLREHAHRHIMRAHYMLGQCACAVRQYQICAQVMRDELGITPSAQTTELWQAVANNTVLPAEAPIRLWALG